MRIGVPRETAAGERRVALVPEVVGSSLAFEVLVQRRGRGGVVPGCGLRGGGRSPRGRLGRAEAVVKVQKPSEGVGRLREGQVLIGFLQPLTDPEAIERLAQLVIAFAMESIPRITRAQAMDALSSQATVSVTRRRCSLPNGYRVLPHADDRRRHGVAPAKVSCSARASQTYRP
jgi:NAD(P) transhydrogenase subunit alpha